MYKKTLLSVAIASALSLTGCLDANDPDGNPKDKRNAGAVTNELTSEQIAEHQRAATGTYPVFNPAAFLAGDLTAMPLISDLVWDTTKSDGTFSDVGPANPIAAKANGETYNPVTAALGSLSGASTVAPIDIRMSGLLSTEAGNLDASAFTVLNDAPAPNPNQNVFLLELDYSSGSPLQGLSAQEPPTIIAPSSVTYTAEEITLDGTSYIRINPLTPLKPNTRYVVVITDGVKDAAGEPLIQHPGLANYAALTNETRGLASTALAPIRDLVNKLWENLAVNYFDLATNKTRTALGNSPLTADNITLSYSFTTSGDEKVLNYNADPKQWFNDQLTTFLGLKAAKAVTGFVDEEEDFSPGGTHHISALYGDLDQNGKVDHGDVTVAKTAIISGFPDEATQAALATAGLTVEAVQAVPLPGCSTATAGETYIACMSAILGSSTAGPFAALLPKTTTTVDFSESTAVPIAAVNNAASFRQGSLSIPYYSHGPSQTLGGAPLKYYSWEANDALAYSINNAFKSLGLTIPQGLDPRDIKLEDQNVNPFTDSEWSPVSTAVNHIFPFPKVQETIDIPVIAVSPTLRQNPGTPMKTVILGHGLFGDRTQMIGLGANLVAIAAQRGVDLTALAIDQPLHGVTDANEDFSTLKTENERHFNYGEAGAGKPPTDIANLLTAATNGGSGSMFLNVESFLTSRDNNRQNVMDLLSLRRSIGSIDIDADETPDLDSNDVYYNGFSLGTLSAQAFVAVSNDTAQGDPRDDIKASFFSTPGGGISRFMENSPTFAPDILNGLGLGFKLTHESSSYQVFLNTLQASFDSFDAINFVGDYEAQDSKVVYFEAVNDTLIPVSQADESRTLKANLGDTIKSVIGNGTAAVDMSGSVSYLSGAEPLISESGATAIESAGTEIPVSRNVIRFTPETATHFGACENAARAEYVGWMASLALTEGTSIAVSADTANSRIQTLPLPALDPDQAQLNAFTCETLAFLRE